VAASFSDWQGNVDIWKHHKESVTCVAAGKRNGKWFVCSGGKDGDVCQWDLEGNLMARVPGGVKRTKKLLKTIGKAKLAPHVGHSDHILTMDVSSDGKFLVSYPPRN
jgi:WD40 repeat protein